MVLILSGAGGGGGGGGGPAALLGTGSAPPAPTPLPVPSPPTPTAAPTRGAAASYTMRPAALLLLPSLLALLAHGKGPRASGHRTGAGADSQGSESKTIPAPCSVRPVVPPQAPRPAGCAVPGADPAGRGAGSTGGKPPRLPPFAPGRDLAFNHLPGSNGISLLQFITPPPPRTHALTRALPRSTPGV